MLLIKRLLPVILLIYSLGLSAQVVYEDINNTGIYEFLDEMASLKLISVNSVVKPYSRFFISQQLQVILKYQEGLNTRQRKELFFYLQDYQIDARLETSNQLPVSYDHKMNFLFRKKPSFAVPLNPLAFQYKDSLFTLSMRPVGGFSYLLNENGNMYHRYWGASAFLYIGKYFGGYASLRDNYATQILSMPEYFTPLTGGLYKLNEGGREGGDWSEMRGGITVAWKWGSIGLMKDFFSWGTNYHGANILSGHAPSFPYVQLHINPVKWFDFNYIHGWLASKVIDSTRSYWVDNEYRVIFHNKYIAANMFTFIPWRGLNVSFGNSIVYSGDINPGFLIPFMFFKSVDHSSYFSNDGGSNAQMFFDISSRQIKYLHLYITLFIDELKTSRILNPDEHNFTSWKFGFRLSDFPLRNLIFTGEYTRTQPGTYQHYLSTTNFTSNRFNMGHYMRDNSQEVYGAISWKPLRGLSVSGSFTLAEHGDDYVYSHDSGYDITKVPVLKNRTWQNYQAEFQARYELVSNCYLWLSYLNTNRKGDIKFGPEIMHGKTNSLMVGLNLGF